MYVLTKFTLTDDYCNQLSELHRFQAINPGFVKTPLTEGLSDEVLGADPLTPSDIADAILYALSVKQHVQVSVT